PGAKAARAADPWAYAPLPHARRSFSPRWWIAATVAAVVAAGAAAIWMWRPRVLTAPPANRPAVASVAKASETNVVPSASPLPIAGAALPSGSAGPGGRREPEPPVRGQKRIAAPRAAAGSLPASLGGEPPLPPRTEAPPPLPHPAGRAVDGRTYIGALVAPNGARVELGGIVYSETNASALLNGRILPVGAVVEGMTISAIQEDRVELSAEGLTVHLTLH
ncbi:MAG TPA: hypothetical protein VIZ58_06610, partial [Thermoanaerobaculia bacterium]